MRGRERRVAIVGAGVGGLVAALLLAARGAAVTVLERDAVPGGKLGTIRLGDRALDAGATLLTARDVFEEVFAAGGRSLQDELGLSPVRVLGRHVWHDGTVLDLHAEPGRNAEAIGEAFGAAEARGYRAMMERAARVHATLDRAFLRQPRPTALGMASELGMARLLGISPFAALGEALAGHFRDPRLLQLFGRYATYVGAAPALAPATLLLVAEIERQGVWRVAGGVARLAGALAACAEAQGAELRCGAEVAGVTVAGGRAAGVVLADGARIDADAVVLNADLGSVAAGRLGAEAARAVDPVPVRRRSHSAITWAVVGRLSGRPALHTNLVFPDPAQGEHAEIALRGRLPRFSTLHLAAQDRGCDGAAPEGAERVLVAMSAPARGEQGPMAPEAMLDLTRTRFAQLAAAGFTLAPEGELIEMTTPADFERRYPGTGGALYGPALHGWGAAFERPRAATRLPGLFLAGGGTHPGAGLAMAALSGRFAADAVIGERR